MIPRETDFTKEGSSSDNNPKTSKASSSKPTTTTSSWSMLKDPRIVRVSRAFGGKDRHSKVCTVRGLRDRRVRLSVPTAIQLYDLQDRLGLNQPSKVVDWLLNAAKHEIDDLPPLQIPPGSFSPTLLPIITSHDHKHGLKIGGSINWPSGPLEQHNRSSEGRSKDVSEGTNDHRDQNWGLRSDDQEKQYNLENQDNSYVSSNHSSSVLPLLMNASSSSVPYNSFVRWDPSNLTLSHPPRSHGLSHHQPEDWPNFSLIPLQPTVSTPSGSHQVLVCQPGMTTQPYFHSQIGGLDIGDHQLHAKEVNFQSAQLSTTSPLSSPVGSSSQPVRQIHFNMMTANLLPSQSNDRLS